MQTVNNLILNTNVAAADGNWRNVSNFVASSIQIIARTAAGLSTALTGTIWIEVSNDPTVNTDNLATQIVNAHACTQTLHVTRSLIEGRDSALAVIARCVGVENHRQGAQPLLRAVVRAAGTQIIVDNVAIEGGPVAI